MEIMVVAFNFERSILARCKEWKLDRVVVAVADGVVKVQGDFPIKAVNYLIFELAKGDIRSQLDLEKAIDVGWRLRVLHHTAVGLRQLHGNGIAHQDLKPSNVLVFDNHESKIADLGRAAQKNFAGPYDEFDIAGDKTYAPLELMYGQVNPDWNMRRFGCDAYHLGSLATFFFGGISMTAAILTKLGQAQHPSVWTGDYESALPYLKEAFDLAVRDFQSKVQAINDGPVLAKDLTQIVRELCEPDPTRRGDPNLLASKETNHFSLERYVSRLNALAYKAEKGLL